MKYEPRKKDHLNSKSTYQPYETRRKGIIVLPILDYEDEYGTMRKYLGEK